MSFVERALTVVLRGFSISDKDIMEIIKMEPGDKKLSLS